MATTGVFFRETFEGDVYFPLGRNELINNTRGIENCNDRNVAHGTAKDWTLMRVDSPLFNGMRSCQFEIHDPGNPPDQDLLVGGSDRVRSEVVTFVGSEDDRYTSEGMWYAFAVLFPSGSSGLEADPDSDEVLMQWWLDGDDDTVMRAWNGSVVVEKVDDIGSSVWRYDLMGAPNSTPVQSGWEKNFVKYPLDKFIYFVFHFIHSTGSDGLVEVWRDGVKIFTIPGKNMHVSSDPKHKVGVYKSDYTAHPGDSKKAIRRLYFADIKVGDKTCTYEDMVSSGTVIEPPPIEPIEPPIEPIPPTESTAPPVIATLPTEPVYPTTGPIKPDKPLKPSTGPIKPPKPSTPTTDIVGFKLVSAASETELSSIVENGSYSIMQYGPKLNIKADTAADITKVAFELTGAMSLSKTDKAAPFSLHGDEIKSDGSLNYYYGNWNPPLEGSYTLKATPYRGEIVGVSSTIHFTFVK